MHRIENLTTKELSIIALAVDHFLCNGEHGDMDLEQIENLFLHIDTVAEAAEEIEAEKRLVEKTDNLLVINFHPQSD